MFKRYHSVPHMPHVLTLDELHKLNAERNILEFRINETSGTRLFTLIGKFAKIKVVKILVSTYQETSHPDVGTPMSEVGSRIRDQNRGRSYQPNKWMWLSLSELKKDLWLFGNSKFIYIRIKLLINNNKDGLRLRKEILDKVVELEPVDEQAPEYQYLQE